jgi:ATP-dependent exoDNAse (exonuclease V) beta subunit
MSNSQHAVIADAAQRAKALDVKQSYIVQAPAGSGKTELLIQRILALLAVADAPEEILSITFTRKAAGEMKTRLLEALDRAASDERPDATHERETWTRARVVLERDQACNWNLQENPARLQIMTIDSFCSSLSRRMPWIARLGDQPGVTDDAEELYLQAAENLLAKLESDSRTSKSIEFMLQHLDNRMPQLRQLIVVMLARRDQWIRHLIDSQGRSKQILESALEAFVVATVEATRQALGQKNRQELLELALFASSNLDQSGSQNILEPFVGYTGDLTEPSAHLQWLSLANLLLTGNDSIRKRVDVNTGFPPNAAVAEAAMKEKMQLLLAQFATDPDMSAAIVALRGLPAVTYDEQQWRALQSLIDLLPLAVIELRNVFRMSGKVDFVEIAGSARVALGSIEAPEDLLLQLDNSVRHILVDEFQDTSYTQYALLQNLTIGWEKGDGRTLFVVGDPMQSIYRFREADVGLFLKTARDGIGAVDLEPLCLTANFRSQAGLVEWFNQTFPKLFPTTGDMLVGAVPYARADAVQCKLSSDAVSHRYFLGRNDKEEAERVLELVQDSLKHDPDGTIAVLVRSRTHLIEVIRLFNQNSIPFQAQDLDQLSDRPVAHDIVALTRALLHPGDSVAWLSVLRAPWCGMSLDDLLLLTDGKNKAPVFNRVFNDPDQVEMFSALSADGSHRLERIRPVLRHAIQQKGRVGLRQMVESAWLALGGPAVVDESGLSDAEQLFRLLDQLDAGGDLLCFDDLERGLTRLYASPDPTAEPNLQVMTIHKAKGLEFDTVIIPGLGRTPRRDEKTLLRWIEHPEYGLLLAPVPPAGEDEDNIYRSIGKILRQRDEHETLRLFYVAATRAKKHLHLLGHVKRSGDEDKPESSSLLASVWESISDEAAVVTSEENPEEISLQRACIRRLPAQWRLPELPPSINMGDGQSVSASEVSGAPSFSANQFSLRSEEGRLIGVSVHRWLETFAGQGITTFAPEQFSMIAKKVGLELSQAGVPADRLESCTAKVVDCLRSTLDSDKGQWILAAHSDHACEKALSGMVDERLVHASIDRTFVDNNTRWVIDYKTSKPATGESLELFLQRETEHYQGQLDIYTRLFAQLEPERPVKGALYFPAIDAWKVVCE